MTVNGGKIDRGAILDKAITKLGYSKTKLARELEMSRTTLYRKLGEEDLPDFLVKKVGMYLRYDFSKEIPDFKLDNTPFFIPSPEVEKLKEDQNKKSDFRETMKANFKELPLKQPLTLIDCKDELIAIQREYIALQKYTISLLREKFANTKADHTG
jgi:hypothetical protein